MEDYIKSDLRDVRDTHVFPSGDGLGGALVVAPKKLIGEIASAGVSYAEGIRYSGWETGSYCPSDDEGRSVLGCDNDECTCGTDEHVAYMLAHSGE